MSRQKQHNVDGENFQEFIKRQYGDGVLTKANDVIRRPRDILRTVLSLDIALNGGIPDGSIVLMSGKQKSGKTYLCLNILNNAIMEGRDAFYFNVEANRCSPEQIQQVCGENSKKLHWISSTDQKILSAEDWLQILERTVKDHKKAVIVVDSLAQLATITEQIEDLGSNKDMSGTPKLMSTFFRRMQPIVSNNDIIIIFISHLITSRDPTSKQKWVEKGGVAIQYACSVWINAAWKQLWDINKDTNEIDGQDVHLKILCSALGKPYIPCILPVRYDLGVDVIQDIATNAENIGLVEKSGAWYSIPMLVDENGNIPKFQGMNNLIHFLRNNKHIVTKLDTEIRKIVLPDIIYDEHKAFKRQDDKVEAQGQETKSSE